MSTIRLVVITFLAFTQIVASLPGSFDFEVQNSELFLNFAEQLQHLFFFIIGNTQLLDISSFTNNAICCDLFFLDTQACFLLCYFIKQGLLIN